MSATTRMNHADITIAPSGPDVGAYHDRKHRILHRRHADQLAYRAL